MQPQKAPKAGAQGRRDRLRSGAEGFLRLATPISIPAHVFARRRERFREQIGEGAAFIPGARLARRSGDVDYVFSEKNSHFRISFAASDETIERGVEVLNRLAAEM